MIIHYKKYSIFFHRLNNNYLVINQNNGAWFITNQRDKNKFVDYLNSKKRILKEEQDSIVAILKQTRFFDTIKKTKRYGIVTKKFTSMIISVTRDCNLHCTYCWAKANDIKSDISFETIKYFADKILYKKYCGNPVRFQFSGGEPTLRLEIIEQSIVYIQNLSKKRKITPLFQIQTNAVNVSKKFINIIKKYNIGVGVSIDQVDPTVSTGRVFSNGDTSTKKSLENVKILTNEGIEPVIISTISKYNANEIYKIPFFMKENGIHSIRVNLLIIGRGGEKKFRTMRAESEVLFQGMKKMIDTIYNLNLNNSKKDEHIYDLHIAQIVRKIMYDRNIFYPCAQSPCGSGRQVLSIFPNGDIFPCDGFYRYDLFKCGNIFKNSIDELKKSTSVSRIRERDVKKISICKDCIYNNYCSGGCIQDITMENNGYEEILKPTPYCEYYFKLISYLFQLIDEGKDPKLLIPKINKYS